MDSLARVFVPQWREWDARDPDGTVPHGDTFSVFRDKITERRLGIHYGKLFPKGYHVKPNGQIDVVIPGKNNDPIFTQWVSCYTLMAHVSYCIRKGLPPPPMEWRGRIPHWIKAMFVFHGNRSIPPDYLSDPDFDYFGTKYVEETRIFDGEGTSMILRK